MNDAMDVAILVAQNRGAFRASWRQVAHGRHAQRSFFITRQRRARRHPEKAASASGFGSASRRRGVGELCRVPPKFGQSGGGGTFRPNRSRAVHSRAGARALEPLWRLCRLIQVTGVLGPSGRVHWTLWTKLCRAVATAASGGAPGVATLK